MAMTDLAANNFLVPNGTFVIELIIFVIVLLVLGWYVAPPVQKALRERQERVEREIEESRLASEKLAAAQERYNTALAEARAESSRIREDSRAEGRRVLEQLRTQAQSEAAEIERRGADELASHRTRAVRELRPHIGELAATLAGRVVGDDLSAMRRSAIVTRFLGELEGDV